MLAEALQAGLSVARMVLIASPANYGRYARGFATAAGLSAKEVEDMLDCLREAIGREPREMSMRNSVRGLTQPALFIHSADDPIAPIAASLESAAAWAGARHHRVEGLGHRRILGDASVVAAAVAFITAEKEKP